MRRNRFAAALLVLGPVLGPVLSGGCSGGQRESGTQIQETEEMKAQTEEMRDMYEGMGPRVE